MANRLHQENLGKHKLTLLQKAAREVIDTHKNEFSTRLFQDNVSDYANLQKLHYHGLIFKVKRGVWGITRNGWSFLRGELDLPKWVLIRDNHIVERSNELINVKDVYRGAEIIATTFLYFDELGNPVGTKPSLDRERQMALI